MVLNSYILLPLAERGIDPDTIAFTLHLLREFLDGSFRLNGNRLASSKSGLNGLKVRQLSLFILLLHILHYSQLTQVGHLALLPEKAPYHVLVWLGTSFEVGVCLRAII